MVALSWLLLVIYERKAEQTPDVAMVTGKPADDVADAVKVVLYSCSVPTPGAVMVMI